MPYLPVNSLQVVLNPRVFSHMNIGQVEVHPGYAAKALGWEIATLYLMVRAIELLKR